MNEDASPLPLIAGGLDFASVLGRSLRRPSDSRVLGYLLTCVLVRLSSHGSVGNLARELACSMVNEVTAATSAGSAKSADAPGSLR